MSAREMGQDRLGLDGLGGYRERLMVVFMRYIGRMNIIIIVYRIRFNRKTMS